MQVKEQRYENCILCPRECGVNRYEKTGACKVGAMLKVSRAALHMWEEPCISGTEGSGTIFFSGCNMGCVYCQNIAISTGKRGKEVFIDELADMMLDLMGQGANNINLVTPSHYVPSIVPAIKLAKSKGMNLPIVYNTSAYEKVETLKLLEGLIDIYLPDFKYLDSESGKKYSYTPDYPEVAKKAIAEMVRQVPKVEFDEKGIMQKGVIVRHLLLPGHLREAKHIVGYLHETYGDQIYISLMSQYTPMSDFEKYPNLNEKVKKRNYDKLIDYAVSIGVEQAFIQEGDVASESFIPEFDME
ncbi:MAG: radical SAM protein [Lachnospiraceae bacterium]|nr:radical SAM protein [Lachnospiraceae bacterium]